MFLKLKKKNCSTNGIRHKKQITKNFLTKKSNFIKNIKHSIKSNSGRNSTGCITVRHKGGGLKKKSYFLNQKIDEFNAIVISIVNDSKKTMSDATYIKKLIGVKPEIKLEEGIVKTVDWAKQNEIMDNLRKWVKSVK